jgi:FMN phosphatase YigB (HAD superfamily)
MTLSITPYDLAKALSLAPPGIEVLSLDCFDTLLWRNTHSPREVFAELEADGGATPFQRILAEDDARRRAQLNGRYEVGIEEIYRALAPGADDETLERLIQVELDAEARHCFAFKPTVELMRDARRMGLKVIIVSDTYLSKVQLRTLIQRAAGDEVLALIDEVYCSSEYGRPKAVGLFKDVLKTLKIAPARILHLGDNLVADRTAPSDLGIVAVHLEQFDPHTEQRLRLEAATAKLFAGAAEAGKPVLQPHRAQLAVDPQRADPTSLIGYGVLGPVLDAYVQWVRREAAAIEAERGGRAHLLFMMRDGYLPMRAYETSPGAKDHPHAPIEISRYTAQAASFPTDQAVLDYVDKQLRRQAPEYIAQQMLLAGSEAEEMLGRGPDQRRRDQFHREIRRPRNLAKIRERSSAFAKRMVDYVRDSIRPAPGDTVVLVDLGYNGTVQNSIDGLLRRELDVHVAGRYLLLVENQLSGLDKKGLIDRRSYDTNTLHTLSAYVAVIEQLCTAATGSVIDYGPEGPIRKANDIKGAQSAVRDQIQAAALRYVAGAGQARLAPPVSADSDAERQGALGALSRLLYLPLPQELEVLQSFQHDVNLGSDETVPLFDAQLADEGLKNWGMFYLKNSRRMYLSAELRGQGLPLSLTLMAQARFGMELRYKDFCDQTIEVPILVADGENMVFDTIQANPTHDGYYLAYVPIGECRYSIGIRFGMFLQSAQIESVNFVNEGGYFATSPTREPPTIIPGAPLFEGAAGAPGGLITFEDENAFMLVPPPPRTDDTKMMLAVVFRPIALRLDAAVQEDAAAA